MCFCGCTLISFFFSRRRRHSEFDRGWSSDVCSSDLLGRVMPEEKRRMGLLDRANGLATTQESFTEQQGIRLYGGTEERGSEAICHNAVVEDIALAGQLVIGTDSHTCMAGVPGPFPLGVGSRAMPQ